MLQMQQLCAMLERTSYFEQLATPIRHNNFPTQLSIMNEEILYEYKCEHPATVFALAVSCSGMFNLTFKYK